MYVSPISSRFWFGKFTPAMRAISLLALTLLVTRIRADDHGRAVPLDDAAPLAHGLHGCSDLHGYLIRTKPRRARRGERVSSAHRNALRRRVIVAKGLCSRSGFAGPLR